MDSQPIKPSNAQKKATNHAQHKRVDWRQVLETAFWTDHIVAFVAITFGLFLMSPILSFPGGNPKHLWYVAAGAWLIIGAGIYWITGGYISHLEGAVQPTGDTKDATRPQGGELVGFTMPRLRKKIAEGEAPGFDFTVKNHSGVPLRINGISCAVVVRDDGIGDLSKEILNSQRIAPHTGTNSLVTPGDEIGGSVLARETLTAEMLNFLTAGTQHLYFVAVVVYTDTSRQLRMSTTCCRYDAAFDQLVTCNPGDLVTGKAISEADIAIPRRPFIEFLDFATTTYTPGKPVSFRVLFRNSGGTAATKIRVAYENAVAVPYTGIWDEIDEKITALTYGKPESDLGALWNLEMRKDDGSIVAGEDSRLYVYGKIEYSDAERGRHWTRFCLVYDGNECRTYRPLCKTDDNDYGEGGDPPDAVPMD